MTGESIGVCEAISGTDPDGLSAEQQERLARLLDDCLQRLEQDRPVDPRRLIAEHPDLAGPLEACLRNLEFLRVAAGELAPIDAIPDRRSTSVPDVRQLGDFEILHEIGRGGMGVVYEARQISLDRRVALKVLPFAALLDEKQVVRFKNEAQAAAQIHHPHIVPVYAVGIDRGVHYYAMQRIEGQSLDRAVEELRAAACPDAGQRENADTDGSTERGFLTQVARRRRDFCRTVARLGVQAADALHAAHQYGIVHRDIKPSNLILDVDGNVWITDFGLARVCTEAGLTRTGEVVGTRQYMSPEQALGQTERVDHRTDVFSLGVTLYELLTLRHPFDDNGVSPATDRHVRQEPMRLCRHDPSIPADLENVVLKALAVSRDERYASARELAEDLQRFLDGRPTVARPPTVGQRVAKWLRRHTRALAACVLLLLAIVAGLSVSMLQIAREQQKTKQALQSAMRSFQQAEANRMRADTHWRQARRAVDQLGAALAEQLADVPGAAGVRRDLLRKTLVYYQDFARHAGDDSQLRTDLALTYSKIGKLASEIDSPREAVAAHQHALRICTQLVREEPGDPDHRRRLALCRNNLGLALLECDRTEEAARSLDAALELQQPLAGGSDGTCEDRRNLALFHANRGLLLRRTGKWQAAIQAYQDAVTQQRRLLQQQPEDTSTRADLAHSLTQLALLLPEEDLEQAILWAEESREIREELAHDHAENWRALGDLARTRHNLAALYDRAGRYGEAADCYRLAIDSLRRLIAAAPSRRDYRRDLAVSLNNLGMLASRSNDLPQAEQAFCDAIDLLEELLVEDTSGLNDHSRLGGVLNNLGMLALARGDAARAAGIFAKAVEHQRVAFEAAPDGTNYREFLNKHYANQERALRACGRLDEAARANRARQQLEMAQAVFEETS